MSSSILYNTNVSLWRVWPHSHFTDNNVNQPRHGENGIDSLESALLRVSQPLDLFAGTCLHVFTMFSTRAQSHHALNDSWKENQRSRTPNSRPKPTLISPLLTHARSSLQQEKQASTMRRWHVTVRAVKPTARSYLNPVKNDVVCRCSRCCSIVVPARSPVLSQRVPLLWDPRARATLRRCIAVLRFFHCLASGKMPEKATVCLPIEAGNPGARVHLSNYCTTTEHTVMAALHSGRFQSTFCDWLTTRVAANRPALVSLVAFFFSAQK